MSHLRKRYRRYGIMSLIAACAIALGNYIVPSANALPVQPQFNHFLSTHINGDAAYDDNNPDNNLAQQQYDNRAYPNTTISNTQVTNAYNAHQSVYQRIKTNMASYQNRGWNLVGPVTPQVAAQATYTGQATVNSGRITALAVDPNCNTTVCRVYVGAAGGGVWRTDNGLADKPTWQSASNGLRSNAIGSVVIDPTDKSGRTIYVGTGEESGSSDSEAGVGLFKSTDYGRTWSLVPGSVPAAKDRSIGAVAIDPGNPLHLYIGTDVARHGSSAVNGGRFTPPDAPQVGLYETQDGGRTFKLVFSKQSDTVSPGSPNGSDFFRGGVSNIQYYKNQIYFSMFDYGLYRSANGSFEQVFASPAGGTAAGSASDRTEFSLAPMGQNLRIYLGNSGAVNDTVNGYSGDFYRVDNANVPASTLTDGTNNPGWLKLDNSQKGTPGYASYDFCEGQCNYDMVVASPAGHPDSVWIGGSMAYNDIFTANPPSNGRAVQRSTNAGAAFTDMTNDVQTPTPLGMHPDQHALAFAPNNPDIAFIGSDGGLVRTSGSFTNASSQCDTRGLSGADLTDCKAWLQAVPTRIFSLNDGLATIQFQSVTYNPQNPQHDLIGGTQDNGTFSTTANPQTWVETVGGDGGQSVIDVGNPNIRMHTYYGPNGDVNFNGNDPNDWNLWADPLTSSQEAASFYVPLIGDPKISQTMFVGLEHVWRTQDSGGPKDYLRQYCNEITGQYNPQLHPCGDWVPLGQNLITDPAFGTDKGGSYVVAIKRAPSDTNTLWAATRRGRLFISTNANASDPNSVTFNRIDTAAQPNRFISGIAVDPKDPFHAYVSFSGYNAYTPNTPGHVFDVHYNATTHQATWKDISSDLGDQPITDVAYDSTTGNLYVATDFGVDRLRQGSPDWDPAAPGLPMVAVYSLALSESGHVLYAATHGRGAWSLQLS